MRAEQANYSVSVMCKEFEVSRSGFYAWLKRGGAAKRIEAEAVLVAEIKAFHKASRGTYGSPRIHADLIAAGRKIGRKPVAKLMAKNDIVGCPKRRRRNTTDSNHKEPPAPNLLNRNFKVDRPNTVWVTDITYIRTLRGWTYLSVIRDLFNHEIVGWSYADHMRTELVLESLYMAMRKRNPPKGLIMHSDRGSQFASQDYRKELKVFGIVQSMSRKGDCWDNACAESIFSTIKRELVYQNHWASLEAARPDLYEYIEVFYNRKRRHSSNGYLSPVDYERLVLSGAAVAA